MRRKSIEDFNCHFFVVVDGMMFFPTRLIAGKVNVVKFSRMTLQKLFDVYEQCRQWGIIKRVFPQVFDVKRQPWTAIGPCVKTCDVHPASR